MKKFFKNYFTGKVEAITPEKSEAEFKAELEQEWQQGWQAVQVKKMKESHLYVDKKDLKLPLEERVTILENKIKELEKKS